MPRCFTLLNLALALTTFSVTAVRGDITFTLQFNPASSGEARQVANSVAAAAAFYNLHGSFNKHWNVHYNAGIPTAEANYDGYMGFGGIRNERVAFHEAGHTFGMGTGPNYGNLIAGGVWKGQYGNQAQWDTYNDFGDGLHGDGHAVWPSGFNYDVEDGNAGNGFIERYWHTRIMAGIRADMGILSFTKEARNQAVVAGKTAEFRVESPRAATWQWSKNGNALSNGGDISGARTAVLRIANAEAADAGTYRCTVTGAGETLLCRPRQLWIHPAAQLGQWNFDGNVADSVNGSNGVAFGSPAYAAGKIGNAVDLDGTNDYVDLPDAVGRAGEVTVAGWVNWDGGGSWQRFFDFGSGVNQYFFLSPRSGSSTMRLAFKDSINGKDVEYQVNAPVPSTGQWVHLAAVLGDGSMTLYVNGKAAGSAFGLDSNLAAFPPTNNYIGKSQFADPLFNGRVDDFRIYAKALGGAEIWALWGQSPNQAPVFAPDTVITLPPLNALEAFSGQTLASGASDPESDVLTFSKVDGPAWLTVAANGALSGRPGPENNGLNTFAVRVKDPSGAGSDATLRILVSAPYGPIVTSSSTAPLTGTHDQASLPGNLPESGTIGGTAVSADNDESTYVAESRSSKGQTFTTGSNPQGYLFQSFTLQHVNWPDFTESGTSYDIQPGDRWVFEIGTLNGTAKSPLVNYFATYEGTAITGSGNNGTGRFLTFNLSSQGLTLAPDTTYYFEIVPYTGASFLELNSSRANPYADGTAYRGTAAGSIGTGVTLLEGDYAFHADLEPRTSSLSSTVAYWNFEEGTADSYVSYTRNAANLYEGSIPDRSGHGNNLSVWSTNWHRYRSVVAGALTPRTGAANTRSLQNAGSYPGFTALNTGLTGWSPVAWTIEAAIRPEDATNGYQTFIGRDSQGTAISDPALAAFYFQLTPSGALQVAFSDAGGRAWTLTSAANAIQDNKWHAVAATSNGTTLWLYRKNISNGDAAYTLLGSLNLSGSANPALSTGSGKGGDWDPGVFTFARGLYNGAHTDRFFGHLDDIRFSGASLSPADFLYSPATLSPAQIWRQTHFTTTDNLGDAADGADPDHDGTSNLLERAFGGNPKGPDSNGLPGLDPGGSLLTFIYYRAKGFPELTFTVQENSGGLTGTWTPAIGTAVVTDIGAVEQVAFTVDPSSADRNFLRLQVVQAP